MSFLMEFMFVHGPMCHHTCTTNSSGVMFAQISFFLCVCLFFFHCLKLFNSYRQNYALRFVKERSLEALRGES